MYNSKHTEIQSKRGEPAISRTRARGATRFAPPVPPASPSAPKVQPTPVRGTTLGIPKEPVDRRHLRRSAPRPMRSQTDATTRSPMEDPCEIPSHTRLLIGVAYKIRANSCDFTNVDGIVSARSRSPAPALESNGLSFQLPRCQARPSPPTAPPTASSLPPNTCTTSPRSGSSTISLFAEIPASRNASSTVSRIRIFLSPGL